MKHSGTDYGLLVSDYWETAMQRPMGGWAYPPAQTVDQVDIYHDTPVADSYRWLEDDLSPECMAWQEAQQRLTRGLLDASPVREQVRARLTAIWDYPKYDVPYWRGRRRFFTKNDGLQNQAVLYTQCGPDAEPTVLLDPNALSADGTVALTAQAASEDGSMLVYGLSLSGSDWQELRVRDVERGEDTPDLIRWCKFAAIAWKHDGSGFFYNRLPEPGSVPPEDESKYSQVYWHVLGTDQSQDLLIYEDSENKELSFWPFVTEDGAYLGLHIWRGTDPVNWIYYRPIESDGPFVRLLDAGDAHYHYITNDGTIFFFQTDRDAPRGRIIAIDLDQPEHWREIHGEQADTLSFVASVNRQLVVATLHHASHRLAIYTEGGAFVREIELPELGTVSSLSGRRNDTELLLGFESFLTPMTVFRYDFVQARLEPVYVPTVSFAADEYLTRQVFCTSADGTQVPIFLTHRRGLVLNRTNPAFLYGYGGFNVSIMPSFPLWAVPWLEQGGVLAVATLRGGGEYGEAWHQGGMLEKKQHVFDDFIAAGEWLIAEGYTKSERLVINGGSNGGLLVAACLTQRPELYGAVVCEVPVIDMLRYHRFTVGRYWTGEYGNADADPEHFRFLYAYSPLHNLRGGTQYPPTLIMTADTDDRVVPGHARKFAAALQAAAAPESGPILLRVEKKAGHGMGKPTNKVIDGLSDIYAFLEGVL